MSSVSPPAPRALLIPMMDLPKEFEDEINLWYDHDHIPDRLSCDGIESCQRMELSPVRPAGWTPEQRWTRYLHVYTLRSIDVLDSAPYALQKVMNGGRGSRWRQDREARMRESGVSRDRALRTAWVARDVPWAGSSEVVQPEPRCFLLHLRHELGAMEQPVNEFIDGELVPELLSLPGFLGCQRYEAAPQTYKPASEGADAFRHPRWLDIFDLSSPEVLSTSVYRDYLRSLDSVGQELLAAWKPVGSGVYHQRPSPWRLRL